MPAGGSPGPEKIRAQPPGWDNFKKNIPNQNIVYIHAGLLLLKT